MSRQLCHSFHSLFNIPRRLIDLKYSFHSLFFNNTPSRSVIDLSFCIEVSLRRVTSAVSGGSCGPRPPALPVCSPRAFCLGFV